MHGDFFARAFIVFCGFCFIMGAFTMWAIPHVWSWIKPVLHWMAA
jgi:hypothetical protein